MGHGTSSGVQTSPQPGVITREGENFPLIPEELLELSPGELQLEIDSLIRLQEYNLTKFIPDPETQEQLENAQVLHEFAKVAVERQIAASQGKERI